MVLARKNRLAALILSAASCVAVADDDHDEAKRLRDKGAILPLQEILKDARAIHSGHVLEAELERRRGRYFYEVEMLDDRGIVWELKFDAQTGRLLERERED